MCLSKSIQNSENLSIFFEILNAKVIEIPIYVRTVEAHDKTKLFYSLRFNHWSTELKNLVVHIVSILQATLLDYLEKAF